MALTPQRDSREKIMPQFDRSRANAQAANTASVDKLRVVDPNQLAGNKVPLLQFNMRQSRSQGGFRNIYPHQNPITHEDDQGKNSENAGNLWYHQLEAKEIAKRRQQMFLQGLNEQRKLEHQRKKIDQRFEQMADVKTEMDKNARLAKEDAEKEAFQRHFEDASRQNDIRVNHYLSNYYKPPKEKDFRNNVTSERQNIMSSSHRRKIKIMKKKSRKQNDCSQDSMNQSNVNPISHEVNPHHGENEQYGMNHYYPKKSKVLSKEFEHAPSLYGQYQNDARYMYN